MNPVFQIQPAASRHFSNHGWLQTFFSFSFADYYDPANSNWGALRVLNDEFIAPHSGFDTHPHADMEPITYMLDGELEHRDSFGHHRVVKSGGVPYMSAGTGIKHSEKKTWKHAPSSASDVGPAPKTGFGAPIRPIGLDAKPPQRQTIAGRNGGKRENQKPGHIR